MRDGNGPMGGNMPWRMKDSGFTLIELMMVIAILAVLIMVGVPSFRDLTAQGRLRSASSELLSSFFLARSEAIKRNCEVNVKPAAGGWSSGWTVETTATCLNSGVVMENHDSISQITITPDFGTGAATYQATGRLKNVANSISLVLSSTTTTSVPARCLVTASTGQPSLKIDSDGNTANGCN